MSDVSTLIDSLSKFAWPALAAIFLYIFYKPLRSVVENKPFKLKVGEMELSVQEASEEIRKQIKDLQDQVSNLKSNHWSLLRLRRSPRLLMRTL